MNDDERHEGDDEDAAGDEPAGADGEPPPATWAGRQGWSGLPDEEEEEGDAADAGDEEDGAEEGSGLTEEFDELEQEFADDLDTELAGEHEIPEDDPTADEGPDPGDEFDFDEEPEGAVEPGDAEAAEEKAEEPEAAEEKAEERKAAEEAPAGATIEADTPALADQEAAREAALEGLRSRTAEHAAKRGVTDPGPAPKAEDAKEAGEPEAEEAEGDEAKTAVAAAAGAGAGAATAPASAEPPTDGDEKPPRAGVWARFLAASFLIIASMATATSVSLLVYLTDIAKGLGGLPGIEDQLDAIDEDAQNFLIIGSDVRPDQSSKGLSDTTMLLRVDPPNNVITQLSIPRDLRVNIPGHGVDKFNAAYAYGGPELTLEVVKQITGDRIPINHVVNVDFNGFADAVDAIGCVYIDVDRHYFNDNATAASFADQYAEIDIQAGYQRLCGYKALQYVRYRHEDNDIVRAARQQTFLREARQKVPPDKLYEDRNELLDIFTEHTTSDIDDSGTLVGLFKLMLDAREAGIAQIEFPFDSLDEEGYVTASDAPLLDAVDKFLGETPAPAPAERDGGGSNGGAEKKKPEEDKKQPEPKPEEEPEQDPVQIAASEMIDTTVAGQQYAAAIRDQGGKDLKFPILYPTRITPGSMISDDTRYFGIDGGNDNLYHGYKFVVSRPGTTYPTAFYGVSGTDWLGAPLFANPDARRTIGEREYSFFYDGPALRMLAFEREKAMYWVTNTLDNLLTEPQMIAIAQNLSEAGT